MIVLKASSYLIVTILVCLCAIGAQARRAYHGPRCLGPVCLDKDIWKDAGPFFAKYGKGYTQEGKFPEYWYHTKEGLYVYISRYHGENRPIDTIAVSKYPFYSERVGAPKTPFPDLVTEKGIGLGATYAQVVEAYGEPDKVFMNQSLPTGWPELGLSGVRILYYENVENDDLFGPWSYFYVLNDELIAIELSNAI